MKYKFFLYDADDNRTQLSAVCDESQANVLHGYYLQTYKNGWKVTMQVGKAKESVIIFR